MEKRLVGLMVNGERHEVAVKPNDTLLEVLRDTLGFIGTKEGCSVGECGACTVLIEGKAVLSCLTLAVNASGREITTIEGLSDGEDLDPVQQSFIDHGAVQCGFCSPGMILTTKDLLSGSENLNEDRIRLGISGNFCRCTGYVKIVEAIQAVAGG